MSSTLPITYQRPINTDEIKKTLQWMVAGSYIGATPTPEDLHESIYDYFLNSQPFLSEVNRIETLMEEHPDQLLSLDD